MNSSPTHILYVDDNNDHCELVKTLLHYVSPKFVVTSAETADKALASIENQPFDLYIFDSNMPEMSGIDLCQYIRQYDTETPIPFFSAMARTDDRESGLAAGANEYLVKPNDLEKLAETVKRLLNKSKSVPSRKAKFRRMYSAII